jgi:putative tryptophan/tyrosine transport system substrate-binding protein
MRRREFIAGVGSAATWPVVARGQRAAIPVIGYLSGSTEVGNRPFAAAFRQGLGELGFIESQNVKILYQWADTNYDRLPTMAIDLVNRPVDMIVATAPPASALAAKAATTTIPIVFIAGADPVAAGLVASFNRPNGNITGVNFFTVQLLAKRLELLHQLVPTTKSIGLLINQLNSTNLPWASEVESAANVLGVRLVVLKATTIAEIETAFASLVEHGIEALLVGSDVFFFNQRRHFAELSAHYRVPAIFEAREMVEAGNLMSYGTSIADAYRIGGTYAGRILKGEKPAELPVQQSTKVEFVLNMKVAKTLGLKIPLPLLGRADEVIE